MIVRTHCLYSGLERNIHHVQVPTKIDGRWVLIDEGVRSLVMKLNELPGVHTTESCQCVDDCVGVE